MSEVTASNHAQFSASDRIVLIAYLDDADDTNRQTFEEFAESHRNDFLFGMTTDSSAFTIASVAPPALVLYKTFDEGRNEYEGSFTRAGLVGFVKENVTPLLDEITPENFGTYSESGTPLAYIFKIGRAHV